MIGVETSEPNTPPLVIVKVPPVSSSIVELCCRAPSAPKLAECARLHARRSSSRRRRGAMGTTRPARCADGDADVEIVAVQDGVVVDGGVDDREALSAPAMVAFTKKDMKPSLHPVASPRRLLACRSSRSIDMTGCMLTSLKVVSMAAVSRAASLTAVVPPTRLRRRVICTTALLARAGHWRWRRRGRLGGWSWRRRLTGRRGGRRDCRWRFRRLHGRRLQVR